MLVEIVIIFISSPRKEIQINTKGWGYRVCGAMQENHL